MFIAGSVLKNLGLNHMWSHLQVSHEDLNKTKGAEFALMSHYKGRVETKTAVWIGG